MESGFKSLILVMLFMQALCHCRDVSVNSNSQIHPEGPSGALAIPRSGKIIEIRVPATLLDRLTDKTNEIFSRFRGIVNTIPVSMVVPCDGRRNHKINKMYIIGFRCKLDQTALTFRPLGLFQAACPGLPKHVIGDDHQDATLCRR